MKILMVNTSEKAGGAAIAANRLMSSLQNLGEHVKMLVAQKQGDGLFVFDIGQPKRHRMRFLKERLGIYLRQGFSKDHLFDIDPATQGADITTLPEFKEADIIHLHWINQGFLSLKSIEKILSSGKPVVWTMHDMWTFTGICHSTFDCHNYEQECGNCPLLKHRGNNDLSHKVWKKKQQLWNNSERLAFVACSKWLQGIANESPLLKELGVSSIVNPIDSRLYAPRDKAKTRQALQLPQDKLLVLFCAFNVNSPIKGLDYLRKACEILVAEKPELKQKLAVLCVGKGGDDIKDTFPVEVIPMGYVADEKQMSRIYNAVDIFAMPSVQDNLPNTIVEAKASGVPVVGFKLGGIPQMIEHLQDGYLVEPKDASDLAKGIKWLLCEADLQAVAAKSRANAVATYSENAVGEKYLKIYQKLLDKKSRQTIE